MELDRDLQSIQQVRTLCAQAKLAQEQLRNLTQKEVDRIVAAMAETGFNAAQRLAEMAVRETGFGVVADKTAKNQVATRDVHNFIRNIKTVGVIRESADKKVIEIAEPVGVIAGIIPVTNPTSTTLFKAIIALKSRNAIIVSPHPKAVGCITEAAELMRETAESAGAPRGSIGVITAPTMPGTNELMKHPDVALILATGGTSLVKAAYSAGKPAYGVGPGNVPAFIERSADVKKAIADIIASKTFDNGTVCASEQAMVVDSPIRGEVEQALGERNAYFMTRQESEMVARALVTPELAVKPELVGQPAHVIAEHAGFRVPKDTTMLVAELDGVGRDYPLSIEKLSPVIAFYEANGWEAGCERCIEILEFGGIGHTLVIHSKNREIIMEFALKKPAFRILVNTPGTHGAVGYTTNLAPSLTLGCGTWGGNITTDNVTPVHLLNIKRLAFETKPLSRTVPDITWKPAESSNGRRASDAPYNAALQPVSSRKSMVSKIETSRQSLKTKVPSCYGTSGITEEEIDKIVAEFLSQQAAHVKCE